MESKWVPGAIWGPKNPKKKKVPQIVWIWSGFDPVWAPF